MDITIKQANRNDKETLMEFWNITGISKNPGQTLLDLETKLYYQPDLIFVAVSNDGIIGTVMAGYDGKRGWLNFLAVHPDYRHQKIGTHLVKYAIEELKSRGCPKVNIQIRNSNSAVKTFYEKLGFTDDQVFGMGLRLRDQKENLQPSSYPEKGRDFFNRGFNCAQSTALPFAAEIGIPESHLARILCGFGGGIGGQQLTCGALTGAYVILDAYFGKEVPLSPEEKQNVSCEIRKLADLFIQNFGCQDCRNILGIDRQTEEGKKRFVNENMKEMKCHPCVAFTISYLEKIIYDH